MSNLESKAWGGVVSAPLPGRVSKPRSSGLTMVLDKGLTLEETGGFLELCADYVDFVKLSFGTSALYPEEMLRKKISMVRRVGVEIYPGGTLFEVALVQDRLDAYLQRAGELGFVYIEVSDGTIELSARERRESIAKARAAGFTVISEVGKKDADAVVSDDELVAGAEADLAAGAYKVIIEGRESGKGVGVFDAAGSIKPGSLERISSTLPIQDTIWEAPLKAQQERLILEFGPNVNLGNIPPSDVLALEALRVGLRGDTLKAALITSLQHR